MTHDTRRSSLMLVASALALVVLVGAGCGGKQSLSGTPDSGSDALPPVNLTGWSMPDFADVVPPVPDDLRAVRERLAPFSVPLDPTAREASGVIKTLPNGSIGVSQTYPNPGYFDFRVSTPFNAQGPAQLFVNGTLSVAGVRTDRYVQFGLVTNAVYNYAMDPDGNPGTNDANPAYLFNQSALMLFASDIGGNPFAAPFDYNAGGGIGQAQAVLPTGFSFSLRFSPVGATGGNVALKINSGAYGPDLAYKKNNWGWWPDEDYSQARLIAMVYSYNNNASPLTVNFSNVVADDPAYTPSGGDWIHTYGGPAQELGGAVAVDTTGNVYNVGGELFDRPAIVQYTSAGALGWRKTWDTGAGNTEYLYDVKVGPDGNIYCTGIGGPNGDFLLLKYSPAGVLMMQRTLGAAGTGDYASGLCLDAAGNIYVSGAVLVSGSATPFVCRFNPAGTLAWAKVTSQTTNFHLADVILASDGKLYLMAPSNVGGFGDHDGYIFRIDPATGTVQAGVRWGGTGFDRLNGIAEGPGGKLYVCGYTQSFGTGGVVCQFDLATLTPLWQKLLPYGIADAIACNSAGAVYVAGTNSTSPAGPYVLVLDSAGSVQAVQKLANGSGGSTASINGLALTSDGAVIIGGTAPSVSSPSWANLVGTPTPISGSTAATLGAFGNYTGTLATPAGTENVPAWTLDTGGGSSDLLVARHTVPIGSQQNVQIDATTLPNAKFSVWNPTGPTAYTGDLSTNTVFDASTTLFDGDQFYLQFSLDSALSPNDLVVYPTRLGGSGLVTVTPTSLTLGGTLSNWFTVPAGTRTLQLKPGGYNRVANDMAAGLPYTQYVLRDSGTLATIGGPYSTNQSNVQKAVLASGVTYQPVFSPLAYPAAGSNASFAGAPEQIYPTDWPANWIAVGLGTLTEGGVSTPGSMRDYFTQAGVTNTMDADAFIRCELNAGATNSPPYTLQLSPSFTDVTAPLQKTANPRNAANLARGLTFRARNSAGNTTGTFTSDPLRKLSGANSVTLTFGGGGGTLGVAVLPVRTAQDPAGTAFGAVGTITGQSPWAVGVNYLLQYGTAPYTVELDGEFGAAWNDGTQGRVYTVSGSPVATTGLYSGTVSFTNHSPGTYACALRVTDSAGAQYIHSLGSITLPAVGWTNSLPNPDATADNRGKYNTMAIVNGNPAMAYFDFTNDDMMYVRAVDTNGANWGTPVLVAGSGGADRGWDASLAVISGNPAVSYTGESGAIGGGGAYYKRATDANGTAWGGEVTLSGGNVQYTTMVEANGRPAVACYNAGSDQLLFERASDSTGSSWPGFTAIISGGGDWPSMTTISGRPAIAFYYAGNPNYIRANDPNGGSWPTRLIIDGTVGDAGWHNSMVGLAAGPAVAYWDQSNGDLKFCRSTAADGSAWATPATLDSAGMVGDFPSLAVINGNPAVSYWDVLNDDLKYIRATTAVGNSWGSPVVLDANQCGDFSTLLQINSQPAVSYYAQANGGDLRYIRFWP